MRGLAEAAAGRPVERETFRHGLLHLFANNESRPTMAG
jgi:hypothetical protein